MSGQLVLRNRQRIRRVTIRRLRRMVKMLVEDLLPMDDLELGVCLIGAAEMTKLNERFLKHQGVTDVIAFDYRPTHKQGQAGDSKGVPDGEIFICVDEAVAQARRFRTSWQAELLRYLIHGLLHLQGFDDARPASRRRMKGKEDRLLRQLARRFDLGALDCSARKSAAKAQARVLGSKR